MDISQFDKCRILVIGDLMVDEYVWGSVDRISPEAPVPVVAVERENFTLGGAGNVVHNLMTLGASVVPVGVVGTGSYGDLLVEKFRKMGADTAGIVRQPGRSTTRKTRIIAGHQHVLRIDRETRSPIDQTTEQELVRILQQYIPQVDGVLISDYNKGVLTRDVLTKVVNWAKNQGKFTIADPKGMDFSKYEGVFLLTPNSREAALASGIEIQDETHLHQAAEKIIRTSQVENLLITRGKHGMALYEKSKPPYLIHTRARQVFDVSGAGDTVLSVLGLALASGCDLARAADIANTAAGIVVGKVGTATVTPSELASELQLATSELTGKFKTPTDLIAMARQWRTQGKTIVLTNGCFDLIHTGHIQLFAESKRLGDILVVAIDDDASVRRVKGPGRPVLDQRERARILSALDSVDHVTVFSSDQLTTLIDAIQPHVLTKGSNYSQEKVVGHEIVAQYGGRVVLIPITEDVSASSIINTIRKNGAAR